MNTNKLPDQFNRQEYLNTAIAMDIKSKIAEKYISQFRIATSRPMSITTTKKYHRGNRKRRIYRKRVF